MIRRRPRRPLPLGAWPPRRPWWRQPTEWLWLPWDVVVEVEIAVERAVLLIRKRPKETRP